MSSELTPKMESCSCNLIYSGFCTKEVIL
jgi:hypothetical protein